MDEKKPPSFQLLCFPLFTSLLFILFLPFSNCPFIFLFIVVDGESLPVVCCTRFYLFSHRKTFNYPSSSSLSTFCSRLSTPRRLIQLCALWINVAPLNIAQIRITSPKIIAIALVKQKDNRLTSKKAQK